MTQRVKRAERRRRQRQRAAEEAVLLAEIDARLVEPDPSDCAMRRALDILDSIEESRRNTQPLLEKLGIR